MLNISTNEISLETNNASEIIKVESSLPACLQLAPRLDTVEFQCLNWRVTHSEHCISVDQSDHIAKMTKNYFNKCAPARCDILFRTINRAEDDHAAASPSATEEVTNLERQYGVPFRPLNGKVQ